MSMGVLGLLFIVVVVIALIRLPTRASLKKSFNEIQSTMKAPTPVASVGAEGSGKASSSGSDSPDTKPSQEVNQAPGKSPETRVLIDFIDEDPKDIRVCELLGQSEVIHQKKQGGFKMDLLWKERTDSVIEAMRMPVRAVFQSPEISGLLREMETLEDQSKLNGEHDNESFLDKAGFYARLAQAAGSLYLKRQQYEFLTDRATHLAVLAEITATHPELIDDARISDFCRQIESADLNLTREALTTERNQLIALMKEKNIEPKDIEFDPDSWTEMHVKSGPDGFNFSLNRSGD